MSLASAPSFRLDRAKRAIFRALIEKFPPDDQHGCGCHHLWRNSNLQACRGGRRRFARGNDASEIAAASRSDHSVRCRQGAYLHRAGAARITIEFIPSCIAIWDETQKKTAALGWHPIRRSRLTMRPTKCGTRPPPPIGAVSPRKAKAASYFAAVTREAEHLADLLPKR